MSILRNNCAYLLLLAIWLLCRSATTMRTWTYTLMDITYESSDDSKLKLDLHIDRLGRGEYGLSGKVILGVDLTNETEIEILVYRSADGSSEYKLQPLQIDRQSIFQAINNYYKKMVMASVAECSDLPQFNDTLEHVGPATFNITKCQLSTEQFPAFMPEGYYKLHFNGYGPFEFSSVTLLRIEKALY
ncbi:uncharacterized protein LOC115630085 [Scaptodrosophila lebanonensis]|uniref:Uncharacterized protein LOC115630085 n=1 Tax=Drosophila lebanonensis TaxID=7225 RepID=A0A6J2U5Z2_DROLE|nr:uncharacterized protein LOC115630085 [Scaptodrosophila lebanonensis]